MQFGLLALAVLGVGLHSWTGSLWGYWLCAALAGLIALAREAYGRPLQPDPDFVRTERLALWGLGLICAVAAAAAHHGDADDAFYVNLSVWALDHPAAPLLLGDTLHGFEGIPMSLPVFKLLSYEILQAAVARLTGVSALTVAHLWVPPLMAFLIPFAWARLARLLLPTHWLFAVGLVIAQLFLLGDGHASYGDFGLLRLQQGKTVMLDLGANMRSSAANLTQFAVMGEVFARTVLGVERPIIGLLNVGVEHDTCSLDLDAQRLERDEAK